MLGQVGWTEMASLGGASVEAYGRDTQRYTAVKMASALVSHPATDHPFSSFLPYWDRSDFQYFRTLDNTENNIFEYKVSITPYWDYFLKINYPKVELLNQRFYTFK